MVSLLDKVGGVIGNFQVEQRHFLLIFQRNSMSSLTYYALALSEWTQPKILFLCIMTLYIREITASSSNGL